MWIFVGFLLFRHPKKKLPIRLQTVSTVCQHQAKRLMLNPILYIQIHLYMCLNVWCPSSPKLKSHCTFLCNLRNRLILKWKVWTDNENGEANLLRLSHIFKMTEKRSKSFFLKNEGPTSETKSWTIDCEWKRETYNKHAHTYTHKHRLAKWYWHNT